MKRRRSIAHDERAGEQAKQLDKAGSRKAACSRGELDLVAEGILRVSDDEGVEREEVLLQHIGVVKRTDPPQNMFLF